MPRALEIPRTRRRAPGGAWACGHPLPCAPRARRVAARGLACALVVALPGAGGCYLAHERDDEGAPPPPVPAIECSATSLDPLYVLETRALGGAGPAAEIASDGCDGVALAWASPLAVATSTTAGPPSFGAPVFLGEGTSPALHYGRDGRLHVLAELDSGLVRFALAPERGSFVGPERLPTHGPDAALARGPWPRPRHFAASHEDGRLAVVWVEDLGADRRGIVVATETSTGALAAVDPVVLAEGPTDDPPREPRLCVGGGRTVVVWERARFDGTAGHLAWSDDGRSFAHVEVGAGSGSRATASGLDVACLGDGTAVVAWASPDGLALGRLDATGTLRRTGLVTPSGTLREVAYPHLDLAADRALVSFQGAFGGGLAWIDLRGRVLASRLGVDLDGDGDGDTRDGACTLPGMEGALAFGFVGAPATDEETAVLALDRALLRTARLALPPSGVRGPSAFACTARGTLLRLRGGVLAIATP